MVTPSIALLSLSTAVLMVLAGYAWRHRDVPGALPFIGLMVTIAIWSGGYAVALGTFERSARLFWRNVQWFGIAFVPSLWLLFTLEYTGRDEWVSGRSALALSVVPALTVAVSWLAPGWLWQESTIVPTGGMAIVTREFAGWYWVNLAFAYVAFVGGTVLLVGLIRSRNALYFDQVASLVVGAVVAWVGNVVSNFRLGPIPMDYTPFAFTVTAVLFGHALFRYRLLDSIPASLRTGRDALVREMDDGVVVLDNDRRIIDVNPVATEILDGDADALLGSRFETVAPPGLDDVAAAAVGEAVTVTTPDGRRRFDCRITETSDRHGRRMGWMLVFRDVTVRRAYEERLTVVNRILRHNVRNDVTVVIGNAQYLCDESDDEQFETAAARIMNTAEGLAGMADKARQVEALHETASERVVTDLGAVIDSAIEQLRADYDVTVETDLPPNLPVRAVAEVDHAVEMVVENAVEHNDATDARVQVTATNGDGTVTVRVVDNGPGIPPHEREVLTEGTETALEHGSGLGLWLVQWAVRASGGTLSFEGNDPRGSVVEIRLPQA